MTRDDLAALGVELGEYDARVASGEDIEFVTRAVLETWRARQAAQDAADARHPGNLRPNAGSLLRAAQVDRAFTRLGRG